MRTRTLTKWIADMRRLEAAAAAGPWESHNDIDGTEIIFSGSTDVGRMLTGCIPRMIAGAAAPLFPEGMANSQVTMSARNHFRLMLDVVEAAAARREAEKRRAFQSPLAWQKELADAELRNDAALDALTAAAKEGA